jgi:membrane protein implicated in regulation of membrane protease activity
MNKIASILIASLLAIVMLGGFIALLGGSILGGLMFLIGIPFAFPMSTSIVVLFFAVIIVRTVMEKRRQKREMQKYLKSSDD